MEQFKHKFIEEATDLIDELEKSLLELSSDKENLSHIEVIFRAMHSLKGGSAMFGFEKIDAFTHQLESLYDQVRKGKRKVTGDILDATFKSVDHIKALLSEDDNLTENTLNNNLLLLSLINSIMVNDTSPVVKSEMTETAESETIPGMATYYVKFKPRPGIFRNGTNPLLIVNELVSLGESKVKFITEEIPEFEKLDVLTCYAYWVIIISTACSEDTLREVFMFVDLDCELVISKLSDGNLLKIKEFNNGVDEAYNSKLYSHEVIEKIVSGLNHTPKELKTENIAENTHRSKDQNISSIRVSSEKLDELINLVSELVTRQAALSLFAETTNNKDLLAISEDIEKISRSLRDSTFGIRLIPIDNMVTRFQRLVRELSIELKKDIIFQTEGTETELDKTMIEGLIDPIMHIIRNSIDHGIESPEERKRKGKPEQGKILLKAFYSGANVYMQVTDDGQGIDINNIFNHAVKQGLVQNDAKLTEKEILDFIFLPGFSTAEKITKVSGRGVGMDVVKRKIADLRGELSISTGLNKGTTITIKLPLTLSIIDGLLVKIDNSFFVIPLSSINRCLEFNHSDLTNTVNNLIFIKDRHIPYAYLRNEFGIKTTPPDIEQVIVIEYRDTLFGLTVDHIVGEYQAVLKSLGKMYNNQDIVSGATILGDGTVALLLDPNKIISKFTYSKE